MNKAVRRFAAGLGIATLALSCTFAHGVVRAQSTIGLMDAMKGVWLREEYVRVLKETRSPRRAADGLYEVEIAFSRSKAGQFRALFVYNFHEGIGRDVAVIEPTSSPKSFVLVMNDDSGLTEECPFQLDSADKPARMTIVLEGRSFTFVKVSPSENDWQGAVDFVNRTILAGEYEDQDGRTYIFMPERRAKFPGVVFDYSVGLDFVFQRHDYFYSVDNRGIEKEPFFVFKWKNDALYLYEGAENEVTNCIEPKPKSKPIAVLHRVD